MINCYGYFLIAYLFFGVICSIIWWTTEYEIEYAKAKAEGEDVEESMAVLTLLILVVLWPIKAIINKFR